MPDQVIQNTTAKSGNVQDIINRHKNLAKTKGVKIVKRGENDLDKNSFIKLLVTQLSKQDPLEPMKNKEFISQMAQFSALEQMQNVSSSMNSLKNFQANFLVGKTVSGPDNVHGQMIRGKVMSVIHAAKGQTLLRVNGKYIKIDNIKTVEENVSRETNSKNNYPPIDTGNVNSTNIKSKATQSNTALAK